MIIPNSAVSITDKLVWITTKTPYFKTANSSLVLYFDLDKLKAILDENKVAYKSNDKLDVLRKKVSDLYE